MTVVRQFGLLLWKNYIQQKRQILVTLVEIALPLLFSAILIVLRQKIPFINYPNTTVYHSFSVDGPPPHLLPGHFQLAYVPSNASVVRQVAEDVQRSLGTWVISSGESRRKRCACAPQEVMRRPCAGSDGNLWLPCCLGF
ncbi:hypothetical protein ANANG_G00293170 [Anguilla anguilla]|uniref:ABC-2 type transporter domain-containing protein n=1 Tax=Anguilla anguilla TaxID=7936 RepID=A0A9D3RJ85_ANGAN|nr:hypothetical protein ANANG_G00293170 [Anguilla anguilla]